MTTKYTGVLHCREIVKANQELKWKNHTALMYDGRAAYESSRKIESELASGQDSSSSLPLPPIIHHRDLSLLFMP